MGHDPTEAARRRSPIRPRHAVRPSRSRRQRRHGERRRTTSGADRASRRSGGREADRRRRNKNKNKKLEQELTARTGTRTTRTRLWSSARTAMVQAALLRARWSAASRLAPFSARRLTVPDRRLPISAGTGPTRIARRAIGTTATKPLGSRARACSSTDRAPDFESGGCRFEPCRAHQAHRLDACAGGALAPRCFSLAVRRSYRAEAAASSPAT